LAKQRAIPQQEYENALASAQVAGAQVQQALSNVKAALAQVEQAKLNLGYTVIRSPISGIIVSPFSGKNWRCGEERTPSRESPV
jgi:HlyD family secretion protein